MTISSLLIPAPDYKTAKKMLGVRPSGKIYPADELLCESAEHAMKYIPPKTRQELKEPAGHARS